MMSRREAAEIWINLAGVLLSPVVLVAGFGGLPWLVIGALALAFGMTAVTLFESATRTCTAG